MESNKWMISLKKNHVNQKNKSNLINKMLGKKKKRNMMEKINK